MSRAARRDESRGGVRLICGQVGAMNNRWPTLSGGLLAHRGRETVFWMDVIGLARGCVARR